LSSSVVANILFLSNLYSRCVVTQSNHVRCFGAFLYFAQSLSLSVCLSLICLSISVRPSLYLSLSFSLSLSLSLYIYIMANLQSIVDIVVRNVDYQHELFIKTAALVVLAPLIWNIVARAEYYTHFLTKTTGSKYIACYIITVWVFLFSLYRDFV
jgi:hypothetical protein